MRKVYRIELEFEIESESTAFTTGDPLAFLAGLISGLIHNAVEKFSRGDTRIVGWKYIKSRII